ncbi:MAG: YIP1 family protein [FCB group bacterium]|nr:YIP1 family protein [FCB group bacterium]
MEQVDIENTEVQISSSKGLSLKGVIQVLYQPSAFFQQIKKSPKILIPYIVLGILAFIFLFSTIDLVMQVQMNSPQFQQRMQGQELTPQIKQIMKISILGGGVIAMLLTPLIEAALAIFWGNFVLAGKAKFKKLLSVMIYGEIIYALGWMVTMPFMLLKHSALVSFSLAPLVAGQGPESMIYMILSKINLFLIWEIIAVGIGLSIIYGVSRNKGYLLSFLSVGMLSVLQIIFTGIGKLFF